MRHTIPSRLARIIVVGLALIWGAAAARATTGEIPSFTLVGADKTHAIMCWEGQGTGATAITAGTNGQVPVGSTGADPVFATIGTGTGISTTTGAGTLTINNTGVTSIVAGTNITVSGATGAVTVNSTAGTTFAIVTKTANYNVATGDAGTLFNTTGASGTVIFTLPSATGTGNKYSFQADAAQIMEVLAPASTTIRFGGQVSASAGNIQTTTGGRGNVCHVVDFGSNTYIVVGATGSTWTVN